MIIYLDNTGCYARLLTKLLKLFRHEVRHDIDEADGDRNPAELHRAHGHRAVGHRNKNERRVHEESRRVSDYVADEGQETVVRTQQPRRVNRNHPRRHGNNPKTNTPGPDENIVNPQTIYRTHTDPTYNITLTPRS